MKKNFYEDLESFIQNKISQDESYKKANAFLKKEFGGFQDATHYSWMIYAIQFYKI